MNTLDHWMGIFITVHQVYIDARSVYHGLRLRWLEWQLAKTNRAIANYEKLR